MKLLHLDDTMLMAFADNQLDESSARQIRDAANASPDIAARIEMFRQTASAVRAIHADPQEGDVPLPVRRATARAVRNRRLLTASRFGLPIAAAIGGLLFGLFAMPALSGSPDNGVDYMLTEVAEYHAIYAGETAHLVEVSANQRAEIEGWLGARIGLPLRVPDLDASGLQFRGARMLVVDGKPVAQLMYEAANGDRVALCVGASGATGPQAGSLDHDGTSLEGRLVGGHVYVAAGPTSRAELLTTLASDLPRLIGAI